jgi:peptidoglycan/LPS O-acetylase OafA/YrhL
MNESRADTDFLRAVAICLIVNSHMDAFYPISHMATGGMLGNSLFFMVSSLGLFLSYQQRGEITFASWYARRILRIYPSVWGAVLMIVFPVAIYSGNLRWNNILPQLGMFFFPPFWFLQALLLFYVLIFVVLKSFSNKRTILFFFLLGVLYISIYSSFLDLNYFVVENLPFNLIFYLMVVILGVYFGMNERKIQFSGKMDVFYLLLSLVIIYFHKYLMTKGSITELQCIQHLATFPFLFFSLRLARCRLITGMMKGNGIVGKLMRFLCSITLELFMANNAIIIVFRNIKAPFPWNALVFLGCSIVLAVLVKSFGSYMRRKIQGISSYDLKSVAERIH